MVCGASGIGKTSFIDLFIGQFNKEEYIETFRVCKNENVILPKTRGFPVKEKKIKAFNLKMIDSPGYGDNMDIATWKRKVISEIKRRFDSYTLKSLRIQNLRDDLKIA